jgi:predicted MPP superfamily phosphohydrolase
VNLPLVGRPLSASEGSRLWPCGLYRDGGRQLYVTGGVGTSILPVRFRAPPEIAIVTLRGRP